MTWRVPVRDSAKRRYETRKSDLGRGLGLLLGRALDLALAARLGLRFFALEVGLTTTLLFNFVVLLAHGKEKVRGGS